MLGFRDEEKLWFSGERGMGILEEGRVGVFVNGKQEQGGDWFFGGGSAGVKESGRVRCW